MIALVAKTDPLGFAFYADMPLYNALVAFCGSYGIHDLVVLTSPHHSSDLRGYSFDRLLSKKQISKILNASLRS